MNSASTLQFMSGRINLIIVEDEESLLSMLRATFSSPYINIVTASEMREAGEKIAQRGAIWHCWIVDMCLGERKDAGTALIEENNNFPFAIVYSGLGSMEGAARAIQKGAAAVIDKGVDTLEKLVWEACSLMPLGVLCKGVLRKKKELLFLFKEHSIRDPNEWADKAGITLRQMENISMSATGMPPSFTIPFYYGMRHLLATNLGVDRQFITTAEQAFCRGCVEHIEENRDYYRDTLFE
ncbi:MAG: response regulator [Chitinispirillaceae bacterium]|nr:response regulator [Chitinispirillaceae bacterium]